MSYRFTGAWLVWGHLLLGVFLLNASAQTPAVNEGGLVNGASFASGPVAAGSIISIFGANLATGTEAAQELPLPANLRGTQVLVNGMAAPLFFVSPEQINAQLPWEVIGAGILRVQVVVQDAQSTIIEIEEEEHTPGLFATNQGGDGQGAILISLSGGAVAAKTGTLPGSRAVKRGEFIEIFCTGLGLVTNQPPSGAPASGDPLSETIAVPTVTIGGIEAERSFSGLAPGFAGLYQVNAQIPMTAPIGDSVAVVLSIGEANSNTVAIAVEPAAGELVHEDWPKYRRDLANTGRSAETGISSLNIDQFKLKWKFDSGGRISASPAVATVGGIRMVYIGNWAGTFFAFEADAGSQTWSFEVDKVGQRCSTPGRCRIYSSAAVDNGMVYFGAESGFVYALDAATGSLVWKKQLGNPDAGYAIWSSPAVHNGVVYLGVASHQSAPCVVGRVEALDAATGANVWTLDTIDQSTCPSGVCVGAGVWSSAAIDPEFGTLYIGTGNSGRGCSPPSANATKYPDGILALDLATGAVKSFFQTLPNDLNDEGDIGAAPVLHTTETVNECAGTHATSHWVTVPTKDSAVYTFARGADGLLGDPAVLRLDSRDAIASPAVVPFTQSVSCRPPDLLVLTQGNDIFVPTFNGVLFGIRQMGAAMEIRWEQALHDCPPDNPCPLFSAPAAVNDLIIFGGGDGNIYATTTNGQLAWSFGTLGLVASGPAISHSTVYFGSYDGFLYAVSRNGE